MTRLTGLLALAGVLAGILLGYLLWGRAPRGSDEELRATRSALVAEQQRTGQLESRAREAESRIRDLTEDLEAERDLRHKYEGAIGKGLK
jgi:hypothetical protein